MKQATVFINITYKYPRLADTPNAQTLRWWQAHLDKLAEHELVHGQYALEAAHELDQALNSLSDLDCATVKDVVKALGDATLETLQERQRTYDALTDHGLQQHEHTGQ
jgi:predicted secreted Zn-dependent protease